MANTYSRNTALIRVQYDAHPHCYFYVYAPNGLGTNPNPAGTWTTPRPIGLVLHPGGWAEEEIDAVAERYPANALKSSLAGTMDKLAAGGSIVILVEYPLGSGLNHSSETGPTPAHFPENWIAAGRAVQVAKDLCRPGGFLDSLGSRPGDPNQTYFFSFSAGGWNSVFSQWAPESWGLFPRAPGPQATLGQDLPFSDHYVRAICVQGLGVAPASDDPSIKNVQGMFSPVAAAAYDPLRYRPRLSLFGTMVGTLVVGDTLVGTGGTTESGVILSISGSGAATTVVLALTKGAYSGPVNGSTFDKSGAPGNSLTVTAAPTVLDAYGWLEAPQSLKEGMSLALLLEQMNATDLARVKRIPLFAFQLTDPTVPYVPGSDIRHVIPGKYGADDAWDVQYLDANLTPESGWDASAFQFFYGSTLNATVVLQDSYNWLKTTVGLSLL